VEDDKRKQAALAHLHGMLHLSKMLQSVMVDSRATDSRFSSKP